MKSFFLIEEADEWRNECWKIIKERQCGTYTINDGQDNEKILKIIQKSINLYNVTYLQRMNMCDIYYIK